MCKIKCLFLLMLIVLCSSCKESTEDEKAMQQMNDQTLNREARIGEIREKERVMNIVLNDLTAAKEMK